MSVDDDGAGAAYAVLASEMGAGQSAIVADGIGERLAMFDRDLMLSAVYQSVQGDACP